MTDFSFDLDTAVALLLTVGGVSLFVRSLWDLLSAIEARSWPAVCGVMLTSGVVEERDSDGHRLYQAKVAYRYAVDGQEIVGHRAFFGDSGQTSWSVFVRRIVDRYPPGSDVTVYYDPSRPEEAVIVRGVSGAIVAILAFQLVFIALATWFLRASVAN